MISEVIYKEKVKSQETEFLVLGKPEKRVGAGLLTSDTTPAWVHPPLQLQQETRFLAPSGLTITL
jgi:hypothetical protein